MFDSLSKLVDEVIRYREQERVRSGVVYIPLSNFRVNKTAKELIEPSHKKLKHHREREEYYVKELEKSEKELRDKGVTVEVKDPQTGLMVVGCSGSLSAGGLGAFNNYGTISSPGALPKFEPKFDQTLLSIVEKHKSKMLEHREKADRYEKFVAAFSSSPESKIELTVDDVWFFGLGV